MAYIPADNVCMAELVMLWDSQSVETVLHFRPDAPLTPTLMNELGAFLQSWWDVQMQAIMPLTLSLVNIKLTDLTIDVGPVINYATGLPLVGTVASPSLPNNVAVVITKRTLLRGRSYRGRIYHPGLHESVVTNNAVDSAFLLGVINRYALVINPVTAGANWDFVVISKYANNAPRVSADVTPVESLDSDGRVDSQRRRLPGRGA